MKLENKFGNVRSYVCSLHDDLFFQRFCRLYKIFNKDFYVITKKDDCVYLEFGELKDYEQYICEKANYIVSSNISNIQDVESDFDNLPF